MFLLSLELSCGASGNTAAWRTQEGVRWILRQVCQVRWAYQIIPSNRFWITRCDWVTTSNKVTWVHANWNDKHKQTQSERLKCYLLTHTMIMQSELLNNNSKCLTIKCSSKLGWNKMYFAAECFIGQFLSSCGMGVTTFIPFWWHLADINGWSEVSHSSKLLLEIMKHCSKTQANSSTLRFLVNKPPKTYIKTKFTASETPLLLSWH